MIRISYEKSGCYWYDLAVLLLGLCHSPPIVLSGPSPAISSVYTANTSNIVIYTDNNNVLKSLPLSVSGISNSIQHTTMTGDCGNTLFAGPSTCNIGQNINPTDGQIGSTVKQTLQIDYQRRKPLTSSISFSVSGAAPELLVYVTPNLFAEAIEMGFQVPQHPYLLEKGSSQLLRFNPFFQFFPMHQNMHHKFENGSTK